MVEEQRWYKRTIWEARSEYPTSENSPKEDKRSFGAQNIKSWFSFSKPRQLMLAENLCQGK